MIDKRVYVVISLWNVGPAAIQCTDRVLAADARAAVKSVKERNRERYFGMVDHVVTVVKTGEKVDRNLWA